MIAANPFTDHDPPLPRIDLDHRVNISIAFATYINAERQYNLAARRFNEACKELRQSLPPDSRFVIRHEASHYLVQTDAASELDIEEVPSL